VKNISKRLFFSILFLISLIGIAGILFYSLSNYRDGEADKGLPSDKNKPAFVTSISGENEGRLNNPLNVAVADNLIYIADSGNGRISVFSQTGVFKNSINPAPDTQTAYPFSVTTDRKRRIYLTLTAGAENKIMVFDANGRFLYRFPEGISAASDYIVPGKPVAIFSANEKVYVTDVVDQDVKVYDLDGKLITKFGRPGTAKGEFLYPNGVTADDDGYIYVSDSNNGRVQVFNEKGEFSHLFVAPENTPMALPRGIAIDKLGRVHVVDTFKHQVFVFGKKGEFLFSYGKFGAKEDGLSYPNGIAIDSKTGKIYIADKMNNRISVWK